MNFVKLGIIWLFSCTSYSCGDNEFETEEYIPNEPFTIRSCTQRHKHLHIFDSLRAKSACDRLSSSCSSALGVGGYPAGIAEFPHIAAIGWLQSDNTSFWDCGGILITESFVMTAGHCKFSKLFKSPPKLVRLGELRIENQTQIFGIKRIIKHPNYKHSSHYDDIALIELDGSVKKNRFVLPACLWTTHNFNFDRMDAAGWGLNQTGGVRVEVLTKVSLSAVPNSECNDYYRISKKLRLGLKDTQLCAVDPVMDTCQGDSGGPLEIKLYASTKLIPFVVGITSFGSICGVSIPGVYTRVSSYIPWIESVVNETFDPLKCSLRNIEFRNYDEIEYVEDNVADFSVTITNEENSKTKCGGSVIDSEFVLTSASCFSKILSGPGLHQVAIINDDERIKVARIVNHPLNDEYNNDLALVKLDRRIRLDKMVQLICPAPFYFDLDSQSQRYFLAHSSGPALFYKSIENTSDFETTTMINIRSYPVSTANCSKLIRKISNITEIDDRTQFCAGNARFAVPGVCQSMAGGSWIIEGKYDPFLKYSYKTPYLMGVQSFGVDCGFGIPAVASNATSFIPWIDSVLYSGRKIEELTTDEVVRESNIRSDKLFEIKNAQYLANLQDAPGLDEKQDASQTNKTNDTNIIDAADDHYGNTDNIEVTEVTQETDNTSITEETKDVNEKNKIERTDETIDVEEVEETNNENFTKINQNIIDKIIQKNQRYQRCKETLFGSSVLLGYFTTPFFGIQWICDGVVISDMIVLTTARCVRSFGISKIEIMASPLSTDNQQFREADMYHIHPDYSEESGQNDIALIVMDSPLEFDGFVFVANLWFSTTHLPFGLEKMVFDRSETVLASSLHMNPVINRDCAVYFDNIEDTQFCTAIDYNNYRLECLIDGKILSDVLCSTTCEQQHGETILYCMDHEDVTMSMVVGLSSATNYCDLDKPLVFTRVSAHLDWIEPLMEIY